MRKAVLIYNPASGRPHQREYELRSALEVFRSAGVDAEACATTGPRTAGEQALRYLRAGADTVFACGGDGTVNEVLQGVIGTDATLGIIPLGTANALAADLGIPRNPAAAARQSLTFSPRAVAAGKITYRTGTRDAQRYFAVTAGIGADAHLMYKIDPAFKRKYGMSAYYAQATWIWATQPFSVFHAEFCSGDGVRHREIVTQMLAVRISQFGGLLRQIAPGAALSKDDLRLVLFKTSSRARYLAYVMRCMLQRPWNVPGIELTDAREVTCEPVATAKRKVYVEADGEALGELPAHVTTVPGAMKLLMPA